MKLVIRPQHGKTHLSGKGRRDRESGRSSPEVDCGAWFTLAEARERIVAGQAPFLDEVSQNRP
ncbi:MAG TPA: hypothetical protein VF846_07340 [Thermoanaerobaculia bacterium]